MLAKSIFNKNEQYLIPNVMRNSTGIQILISHHFWSLTFLS